MFICSCIDDIPGDLSDTNRLFGGAESILSEECLEQWDERITTDLIDISTEHLPCHRYGAIHLTPDHVEELQSLLELIFEYLETGKKDDHPNLFYCWKCGSPEKANREPIETSTSKDDVKYYKYYVTCPCCSAFRSDNHCRSCGKAIIKHTKGNYHKHDESVTSPQWAFLCPDCGSPVNGFPTIDESELDEMQNSGFQNVNQNTEVPVNHYSTDYAAYREPPPLTDEELAMLQPPPESFYGDFDDELPLF